MATDVEELLETGGAALAAGDWAAARSAFGDANAVTETPEGLAGLGAAVWWQGEVVRAMGLWERAYAGFRRRSDLVAAADTAIWVSFTYGANLGNRVAAAGWAARAGRLVDALDRHDRVVASAASVLEGWVLLAEAAVARDAVASEERSRRAQAIASKAGDPDLELCALSALGSALVDQGRVEEGAQLLDEALAGSLGGEVQSLGTVVFTACGLMRSCYRCADFERVVQWTQPLARFTAQYGCPYVHATCRTSYGAVLVATGDWGRAEAELLAALSMAEGALPAVHAEALAHLAELRLAQGRVDEAARLLVGFEDQPVVLPVLAALRLAAGDVAVATAQRRLDGAGGVQLEASRLREVIGQARLAAHDVASTLDTGRQMADSGAALGSPLLSARGERLTGRALLAAGDAAGARLHLDYALATFQRLETPLEAARTRMVLAEALHMGGMDVAVAEARAAFAVFDDLGAATDADASAAWLRARGAPARRSGPKGIGALTPRERELLVLVGEGLSNPEIAERLFLSRRTVEHHVASILSKLGVRNRTEAAGFVLRHVVGGGARI